MYSYQINFCMRIMAGLLALAATAARADEATVGPGLEPCLQAALQQRPGFVHGWKDISEGSDERYKIAIINPAGKIADAICEASAPGNFKFEDRLGMRRYDSYARVNVGEAMARATAPLIFVGPVRIVQMEIDLDWKGKAAYEYHMILPTGREAVARIDTTSDMLMQAEVLPY
jgi:hypothetical protein